MPDVALFYFNDKFKVTGGRRPRAVCVLPLSTSYTDSFVATLGQRTLALATLNRCKERVEREQALTREDPTASRDAWGQTRHAQQINATLPSSRSTLDVAKAPPDWQQGGSGVV